MNKKLNIGIGIFLLFVSGLAAAEPVRVVEILQAGLSDALDSIFKDLQTFAIGYLSLFILLQFLWTNIHVLTDGGDLTGFLKKFSGSMIWFTMCFFIFKEGPDFLKTVSSYLINKASGTSGVVFDPTAPIDKGMVIASSLLKSLDSTQSVLASLNPFPSIMLGIVSLVILAVSALLAFKILMVFMETKIVIALSPLSFSLLGLNAFKDQGLAPFKYLVSLAFRAMIYGAILATMFKFSDAIQASFKSLPSSSDASVWPPIWAAAIGYSLLGAFALRADSIAVMLASGSSAMSTGDAAAVNASTAAAAGVAGAVGGAIVGGAMAGAAKMPASMSSFMGGLPGGSISNASGRGSGQTPSQAPSRAASMSTAPGGAASSALSAGGAGGMPSAASSGGAPVRPASAGGGSPSAAPSASGSANSNAAAGGKAANWADGNHGTPEPGLANNGSTGGIGGDPSTAAPTAPEKPKQASGDAPRRPGVMDALSELNQQSARNGSNAVHITMNTQTDH